MTAFPSCQTHHTLDDLVLAVVLLHLQEVVAKVQDVKSPLLSKEHDDHAAGPVEAVSEALPAEQTGSVASQNVARGSAGALTPL